MVLSLIIAILNLDLPNTVETCRPKQKKCAQNLHLMTPSSANIGQSGLFSIAQIAIHQTSNYHHRPLGCG